MLTNSFLSFIVMELDLGYNGIGVDHAPNIGTYCRQLADKIIVATLDEVDIVDAGLTVCYQTCNDHGSAAAQVYRTDGGTVERIAAADGSGFAVDLNIGTHSAQLFHVTEAVIPNALGESALALCQAEECTELRLHIGGEAGIGKGFDIAML